VFSVLKFDHGGHGESTEGTEKNCQLEKLTGLAVKTIAVKIIKEQTEPGAVAPEIPLRAL